MSAPLKNEECLVAMYDSYAKTVMRNECRNATKARHLRQERETVGAKAIQYLFDEQAHIDIYPSEHLMLANNAHLCVVTDERLYQAMLRLPCGHRDVLILEFWFGWTDLQIAQYLNVSKRTVYNWRQSAFRSIRAYYEGV